MVWHPRVDEALRSFVVRVCLRPLSSVYQSNPGPATHVPMCGVSFLDEVDLGVAAMFAFCVDIVSGRMMVNVHGRLERERELVCC